MSCRRCFHSGLRAGAALAAAVGLSACAMFSPDGGFGVVADIAAVELKKDTVAIRTEEDAAVARAEVERLLRQPLTADAAVQIALLNNRGLQAAYNELGIAEAEMVAAQLPPSPTLSIERLSSPLEIEIERRIVGNILALATLPARAGDRRRSFPSRRNCAPRRKPCGSPPTTRRAYYRAVAGAPDRAASSAQAQGRRRNRDRGRASGSARPAPSTSSTRRANMCSTPRSPAQLGTARQRAGSERERLIARCWDCGATTSTSSCPVSLPPMPRRPRSSPAIETEAVQRRVDLQIARIEVDGAGEILRAHAGATRFVNLLECRRHRARPRSSARPATASATRGFEVEIQIPIFDFGETRVRQAEQTYMQAVNRLHREGRQCALGGARGLSALPLEPTTSRALPARGAAAAQDHLRRDAAALQRDADRRVRAADRSAAAHRRDTQAIEAQRDFWLASVDLSVAVVGGGGRRRGSEAIPADGGRRRRSGGTDTDTKEDATMLLADGFHRHSAAVLASASARQRARAGGAHSGSADHGQTPCSRRSCRRAGRTISRWRR